MTRRCSHCSNNGHNSRTCPTRVGSSSTSSSSACGGGGGGGGGVKLFGVRLTDGSIIKKSASMGNLSSAAAHYPSSSPNPDSPSSDLLHDPVHVPNGYLSDDPAHATSSNRRGDRKKGTPWTEEEHRMFLIGLQKLGKGDWRGIARNYVTTRTPTQVASHAQKYFIRQINSTRRKRRSSLFDMVPETAMDRPPPVPEEQVFLPYCQEEESEAANSLPSLNLSLSSECNPMETTHEEKVIELDPEPVLGSNGFPPMVPGLVPSYFPYPYPIWTPNAGPLLEQRVGEASYQQVLRPIPILRKEPVNVDPLTSMSQLSLGETERGHKEPSPLSLKLLGEPSRQSAFHPNAPTSEPDLRKGKSSAIQAV